MKNKFIILLALFSPIFLWSQGTITGTLVDKNTGEPIMFASVYIEGTTLGTDTNLDGKYQLNVEAGTYNIVASYVGYPTSKIEGVIVKNKETTYLDFTMSEDIEVLDEIVVKAAAITRTEAALLLQQRKADKIQDAISSEEMSKYAVNDAAGAMTKVTGASIQGGKYIYIRGLGDRYSLTQLNGLIMPSTDPYRNGAQLDMIPARILENIVTSKTFTPDQPGTFTGGAVNIKTKAIPERYFFTINANTSYNSQSTFIKDFLTHEGASTDKFGFGSNKRALDPRLVDPANSSFLTGNIALKAKINYQGQGEQIAQFADNAIRNLNRHYTPTNRNTPTNYGLGFSLGNKFSIGGNPLGLILAGSFGHSFQHLPNYTRANWKLVNNDIGLENQGDLNVTESIETPTLNGLAGLAYKFGKGQEVSLTSIYNHAAEKRSRNVSGERPDNIVAPDFYRGHSLSFIERSILSHQLGGKHLIAPFNNLIAEWKIGITNSSMVEPDTRFFEYQYNSDFDVYSIPASNVQRPFHFYRNLEDQQYDYKLDFTLPFGNEERNKIKFGGLITEKTREFQEYRFQIEEHEGESQQFTGNPEDYMSNENIGIFGPSDINNGYIIGNYILAASELENLYNGHANVQAAYLMATYHILDPLKLVGGARIEHTDFFVQSEDPDLEAGSIKGTDVLPSLGITYNLTKKMNLRAVASRTVARPNLREIAPFAAYDPLNLLTRFGNPDLKRTNITNIDFRWEWFANSGELIAFSAFYKDFKNAIALGFRDKLGREIQFGNPETAELYGIEMEYRKHLNFIPALKDFKLVTNLSFTHSRMDGLDFGDVTYDRERPFVGQPTFVLNSSLIYSNAHWDFDGVISFNTQGDQLLLVGLEETPDTYLRSRSQLDLTFTKSFGPLKLRVTGRNLLNSAYLESIGNKDDGYENDEYIFRNYEVGTTLGVGLSYTFK